VITLLGAGGVTSNEVVKLLATRGERLRLVGRSTHDGPAGAETVTADISDRDQTIAAVAGSRIVFLLAGLKYDHKVWAGLWPPIMANVIVACEVANAKLIFLDNVYAYGKVDGAMTEETPFAPSSRKGHVRAKIAMDLIDAWKAGRLKAMIARSADFYGPGAANGIPNVLVFDPLNKKQKASCLAKDSMPHSYSYTCDVARGLVMLADSETAWNQTWHLPTAPNPPTGKAFIAMAAEALHVQPRYRVLSGTMIRLAGLFNPMVGEVHEMLYQNAFPYLFDSTKFAKAFGFSGTPYSDSIAATARSYLTER
jgi:nucleoside-diphosphate-sugar epimerase